MSAENGLWACYVHGKLIDTDEHRFTTEILKNWKFIGESVASIMAESGCEYSEALKLFEYMQLAEGSIRFESLAINATASIMLIG